MTSRSILAGGVIALALLFAVLAAAQPAAASGSAPDGILFVKKTATGSQNTAWNWTINKTGDQSDLTSTLGQSQQVNYTVTVDAASATDWSVSGTIQFQNTSPAAVSVTAVTDVLSDGTTGTVTCPWFALPFTLQAFSTSAPCTYEASGTGAPPTSNTASVTVDGGAVSNSAATLVNYTSVNETDECITVSDTLYGDLGEVCASDAPATFNYSVVVGPYATCGLYTVNNTASFVTNGTGATGSASWLVSVNVPCANICTLTQGYWKTHSEFGPAPYDATWALLPNGASTTFFLSGQSWYQVFWTPPVGGSRYYQLAHQYMAARLNVLNGAASTTEVDAAIAWATTFFNTYTPSSTLPPAVRSAANSFADLLGQYNNGAVGPGHCS